jgi:acyl-CoA reductase-like NAD-dependent aldehyde dehydrogenase
MQNKIRTISPSNGNVLFERDGATVEEVTMIINNADNAFRSYKNTALKDRKALVVKALDIMADMTQTLMEELSAQMGRPIAFAGVEIDTMRKRADYLLSMASTALSDMPGQTESGFRRWVSQEPVGPVLIVSAWNVSRTR